MPVQYWLFWRYLLVLLRGLSLLAREFIPWRTRPIADERLKLTPRGNAISRQKIF
ncbi:hypothetical protein QUB28_10690 [Microcoleus sp. B4-C3]|uniref:hypothetical protein n=1 Tax=unclassified Microcoleus TaxID=2642155 RepID=UPI002FCFD5EF